VYSTGALRYTNRLTERQCDGRKERMMDGRTEKEGNKEKYREEDRKTEGT
jgi:hypothetical protein